MGEGGGGGFRHWYIKPHVIQFDYRLDFEVRLSKCVDQ